jgi:lysine 2,3-aminomutase
MRHRLRRAAGFKAAATIQLSARERQAFALSPEELPAVAVTPYYLGLMDPADPRCPVRRQALPDPEDAVQAPGEGPDPLGERRRSPCPGVIHRYPDRVVLLVARDCPVRCRHCNRRAREPGEFLPDERSRDQALAYLAGATGVREVILSGGDPLTLDDEALEFWLDRLRRLEHVQTLRIHSRAPVTCPARITTDLVRLLRGSGLPCRQAPLYLLTQFNHPREVTPEAAVACARLAEAGIPLANQSVLLRGINSDARILAELSRALLRIRVRPYYLFQLDPVLGAGRFKVPVSAGLELVAALRGRLSGLGIPTYALDAPGGHGKVALLPEALVDTAPGRVRVRTWTGELVDYPDTGHPDLRCPPWP